MWLEYNRRLRAVVAAVTDAQLAMGPGPDRWPMWATIGHTAWVIQGICAHDVYCCAELNEQLGIAWLLPIDFWN